MDHGHLWNSYNVAIALISKTYARGGTSAIQSEAVRSARGPFSHRNIPCWTLSCWR